MASLFVSWVMDARFFPSSSYFAFFFFHSRTLQCPLAILYAVCHFPPVFSLDFTSFGSISLIETLPVHHRHPHLYTPLAWSLHRIFLLYIRKDSQCLFAIDVHIRASIISYILLHTTLHIDITTLNSPFSLPIFPTLFNVSLHGRSSSRRLNIFLHFPS